MKTEIIKTEEAIKEHIESLSNSELVSLWNEYCQETGNGDDEIHSNDEDFFNTFFSEVMEVVRAISYGEYNYSDKFVKFNGYANLESFNDPSDSIDIDTLVNAIFEEEFTPYGIELTEPEEEETED